LVQIEGRLSNAEIAERVGLSVSAVSERVRKLAASGVIREWRAVLDPVAFGLGLTAFIFVDVTYAGEAEARASLTRFHEIQELHHISGARSYLLKVRVADTRALQALIQERIKPINGITRTETIVVLETAKETTALPIETV
jgi:Lrp/AsnC family leucine-responsive transcriptional regulator